MSRSSRHARRRPVGWPTGSSLAALLLGVGALVLVGVAAWTPAGSATAAAVAPGTHDHNASTPAPAGDPDAEGRTRDPPSSRADQLPSDPLLPDPGDDRAAPDGAEDPHGRPDGPDASNGLPTLGRSCEQSNLELHTGIQEAPRCVPTAMGEVPAAEQGPQVLITAAPRQVDVGEPFTIRVSSRNLVRDRFLPAADGGYYLESAFLNEDGLVRGHIHTACRTLTNDLQAAPHPTTEASFFQAVEDSGGGPEPDTVEITVADGLPEPGITQCAVWAGDGSHRIPMMATAQQFPAFDTTLILVG